MLKLGVVSYQAGGGGGGGGDPPSGVTADFLVDIRDHGADGTAANDTSALLDAIAECDSDATKWGVFIPSNDEYRINQAITIGAGSGCHMLVGASRGQGGSDQNRKGLWKAFNGDLLTIQKPGFQISNLYLNGHQASFTGRGIIVQAEDVSIETVQLENFQGGAIDLERGYFVARALAARWNNDGGGEGASWGVRVTAGGTYNGPIRLSGFNPFRCPVGYDIQGGPYLHWFAAYAEGNQAGYGVRAAVDGVFCYSGGEGTQGSPAANFAFTAGTTGGRNHSRLGDATGGSAVDNGTNHLVRVDWGTSGPGSFPE